jgi:hypothetical protein
MRRTSLFKSVVLAGVGVLYLRVGEAAAQFTHLECWNIQDPHNFSAAANLQPIQVPPFFASSCCKIAV